MKLEGQQTLVSEDTLEFRLYTGDIQYSTEIFDFVFCSKQYASGS